MFLGVQPVGCAKSVGSDWPEKVVMTWQAVSLLSY
jgi:hypothetical protein